MWRISFNQLQLPIGNFYFVVMKVLDQLNLSSPAGGDVSVIQLE